MSTHTAGPWISYPGKARITNEQHHDIAMVNIRLDGEANARLIAAAPELLEAMEACVWYLNLIKPETLGGEGAKAWEVRTKAEAAIRKAKGEL